jgi:DeoR/GlpR family transcriptional regulator of sugar metabolism
VVDGLAHLRVDVALCSVHGLDPVAGMMGTDPAEADTDR